MAQAIAEPAGARGERGGWQELARERALFVRYRLHGDLRAREIVGQAALVIVEVEEVMVEAARRHAQLAGERA